ncbi:acyl-CoA N-acyltransferase [Dendrothele bispora CBS 962.96]|uniref:Acyl-CoA N-acyltransferase n=1 Tax=Dendrothele bispora (strain CBS 962.96) TaxID=1314807 RepID=A0A4S8L893_DENBC|nr:acyl-CoA N-acyltransferase [Dendrothele bispora CBS 962.96]
MSNSKLEGRFTTERLVLRAFQESDTERYLELSNDVRVQPFITNEYIVPMGKKGLEKIRNIVNEALFVAIIETKTGEWVGLTVLLPTTPKNRDVMFGIVLSPDHWNKGYGTEVTRWMVDYAFQWLAMHRVSLGVYELNERAIDLYKRVGFVEEGRKRKSNWVDGRWTDIISMGILEDEWRTQKVGDT